MERARSSAVLALMCLASLCLAQNEFPVLKVGSVLNKPFLQDTTDGEHEGFVKDLMDALAEKLNFTYEIVLPKDNRYGHKSSETGKWTGMVGMAIDGEADLIVADLTQTTQRDTVLDFSTPFMTSSLTILTKKFSAFGSGAYILIQPFSFKLWSFVVVLFVATAVGFYITARITPYEHWSEKLPSVTMCNTVWFLLSYGFKGSNFTPKAFSTRFLTLGWVLSTCLIFFYYLISLYGMMRSGGTSTMMAPNVETLLANPDFKIGVFEFGSTNALLQKSNNPLHKKILARIQKFGSYINSNTEGVEKVLESNGNFGVLMEGYAAEFAKIENCELYTVGRLDDRHYALSFPKESKYKKRMSNALMEVRESGKLHELINKWWNINSKCNKVQEAFSYLNQDGPMVSFTQLKSENFYWLFHTMFAVLAIALVISFVELAIFAATSGKRSDFKLTRHLKYVVIGGFVDNDQDYRIANNHA